MSIANVVPFAAHPECRICGSALRETFLDLGAMPLANSYLDSPDDPDPRFPLHARVCRTCLLVQADATVNPADIFTDYPFFSAMSAPWVEHCSQYARTVTERFGLGDLSQIVEVASNDGTLLAEFNGPQVLGIDPAKNVCANARVPTLPEFFTADLAHHLPRADLVIANNVLGHVPDLNDFVAGLSILLKGDGVLSIEVPHLANLITECQFDTIYHEHFSYFSLASLEAVLHRHGLRVFDVEELAVHGGSLRVFACRDRRPEQLSVTRIRYRESTAGLQSANSPAYRGFASRVEDVVDDLRAWFVCQQTMGRRVAAAGAPAKGNTLLNAVGVDRDDLLFVTDTSPHKQHRYLPGSHVPVLPPEALYEFEPDVVLVLAWNWFDDVVGSFPDCDAEFVHPLRLS